jgi:energy-coupling factor transport system substrate-specific component
MKLRLRAESAALLLIGLLGMAAFVYPLKTGRGPASSQSTTLFVAFLGAAVAASLMVALQTNRLSTRLLAVLAALVAVDASLRLVVVIGLLGFSPIFFLVLAGGFVMGPSFGFALGALTLLLSAVLTAGFGPWLPYQMLACGWVGVGAGLMGRLFSNSSSRLAVSALAAYGCLAGFLYGALLDLWEWPFLLGADSTPISWAPGLALKELVRRFASFYLLTSAGYDAFRAAGNLVLVLLLGVPVISALTRFKRRFLVEWVPSKIQADVRT